MNAQELSEQYRPKILDLAAQVRILERNLVNKEWIDHFKKHNLRQIGQFVSMGKGSRENVFIYLSRLSVLSDDERKLRSLIYTAVAPMKDAFPDELKRGIQYMNHCYRKNQVPNPNAFGEILQGTLYAASSVHRKSTIFDYCYAQGIGMHYKHLITRL